MKSEGDLSRKIGKVDFESKIGSLVSIEVPDTIATPGGRVTGKVVEARDESVTIETPRDPLDFPIIGTSRRGATMHDVHYSEIVKVTFQ